MGSQQVCLLRGSVMVPTCMLAVFPAFLPLPYHAVRAFDTFLNFCLRFYHIDMGDGHPCLPPCLRYYWSITYRVEVEWSFYYSS
jgi:hypothetical protein